MTVRLTVAQALVRFLAHQYTERDGARHRLIPACFGIFGHGNVAGVGQALLQAQRTGDADLPYHLARNEQAMVHASAGFARLWYVPRPVPEPASPTTRAAGQPPRKPRRPGTRRKPPRPGTTRKDVTSR